MEINAADGDRWAKQQTRSFDPNQLKRIANLKKMISRAMYSSHIDRMRKITPSHNPNACQ